MSLAMSEENCESLTLVNSANGNQMLPTRSYGSNYKTTNGQILYPKTLTGSKKILIPTSVDMNTCFEYRFSFKDLMLPNALPNSAPLYVTDLTVKLQDIFTQVTSHDAIKDSVMYSYDPYSVVIAQDQDGIEHESHYIKIGSESVKREFINAGRVIQRSDNSLYVVSSNLRIEKHINIESNTNTYNLLLLYNRYDKDGNFVGKEIKSDKSASCDDLRQCLNPDSVTAEEKKNSLVCIDIIICDILLYMMKTCNLSGISIDEVTADNLRSVKCGKTLPIGWLTPEEKLEKFGKKGVFMDTFVPNKKAGNGSSDSPYDEIPNNLFLHVDMQGVCSKIFKIAHPKSAVFNDVNGIVAGCRAQYAIGHELISANINMDNQ